MIVRRRSLRVLVLAAVAALSLPIVAVQAKPPATPAGTHQQSAGAAAQAAHGHKPKRPHPPKPPHPGPKPPPLGAPPPAPGDMSAAMPRTMRDEITGDFLGSGYDQRMRAENSSLNVYDSPSRGGTLLRSTQLDLAPAPDDVSYVPQSGPDMNENLDLHTWALWGSERFLNCGGCFQAHFSVYHINTIYLARNNQHLFMTGTQGDTIDEDQPGQLPNPYRNYLYQLPADGSCASASCAEAIVQLPDVFNLNNVAVGSRAIGVTSLAAGYVGGHPYLAVGLSDTGVQIYDVSGTTPRLTSTFAGMATGDGSQTPPTALAWDPSGSGLLAIGVIEWAYIGYFVNVDANGIVQPGNRIWSATGGEHLDPTPVSAAISQGPDGKPVVAFGLTDGTLKLVDPAVTGPNPLSSGTVPNTIVAINPIPRIDGTSGPPDYAVSLQSSSTDSTLGGGVLLRWDGTSSALTPQPVSPAADTLLPDRDSFRSWYPGLKEGRFNIQNNSGEPISVSLHARPQAGYGCWYAPSWADAPAFPSQPLTVAGGQTSANYTMGAYTAGSSGGCGATDVTGAWRGYLTVTPVGHPADERVVNLQLKRDMTVDATSDQAGGSTTVSITNDHQQLAAFGLWTITVDTPDAPTAQAAPQVSAHRLTVPQTGQPDVYRFDVAPTTWTVPGAGAATQPQVEAVIPPLTVQARVSATANWTQVGSFLPPSTLSSAPGTITVGGGSFYLPDPAGQPGYQVRVLAGALASPALALNQPAPTANPNITQIVINTGTAVTPEPNGLDQAALEVQISIPTNGGAASSVLPSSDPAYASVYYHDEAGDLVTNLYQPSDYNTFIGIQAQPGAYSNTTLTALQDSPAFDYLSTNSTSPRQVTAFIGTANITGSSAVGVQAAPLNITATPQTGGAFTLTGCHDFSQSTTCQIPPVSPTQPALYQAGSATTGPLIGALLLGQGQNSVGDLPMQWQTQFGQQPLATTGLTITGTTATLSNTTGYHPNDKVDITLAAHGQPVPATIPANSG
jgi:hypothetical protein